MTRAPEPAFAATAVCAAAGVAAVAAGVPVVAAVGVTDDAVELEPMASATVAGTVSFLPHPAKSTAAKEERTRSRIFMTETNVVNTMAKANPNTPPARRRTFLWLAATTAESTRQHASAVSVSAAASRSQIAGSFRSCGVSTGAASLGMRPVWERRPQWPSRFERPR